ncbi:WD40-repeat-containing domain protein [Pisolithus sp. B1]|nr:WD40-repeat-containing domain protein [Pisolithus sp. B1]
MRIWDAKGGVQTSSLLKGYTDWVTSVAFSPDGNRIVSSSSDQTVKVWDAKSGVQIGSTLKGHTSSVTSVAFSPDGNKMVSGSSDETVRVWDAKSGIQIGDSLKGHTSSVASVAFSPDGNRIVSGSSDQTVRVWDAKSGVQIGSPLLGHTAFVTSVAFSSDGNWIVSGSWDETVMVWDIQSGVQIGSPLKGHTSSVTSVVFSPDGNKIVSGSSDQTVRIWDAKSGVQIGSPLKGHTSSVTSVAFSPDGNRIVSGSSDHTVRVWDAKSGVQIGSPLQGHTSSVTSVAFSPDGNRIVSGSEDGTVRVWDAKSGNQISSPQKEHTDHVTSVASPPDGNSLLLGSDLETSSVSADINSVPTPPMQHSTHAAVLAHGNQPICFSSVSSHALVGSEQFLDGPISKIVSIITKSETKALQCFALPFACVIRNVDIDLGVVYIAKHYIALRVRNAMQCFATSQLPMQAQVSQLLQQPTGHQYDCVCIKYGCGQVHKVSHVAWQHHLANASSEEEHQCICAACLLGDQATTLPPLASPSAPPDRNHSVPPSVHRIEALRGLSKRVREDRNPNEYVGRRKRAHAKQPTDTSHAEANSGIQMDTNETAGPSLSQPVQPDGGMNNYHPQVDSGPIDPINDDKLCLSPPPSWSRSPAPDNEPCLSPPSSPHCSSPPDRPDVPPPPDRTHETLLDIPYQWRARPQINIQDLSQHIILPKLQETMSFILALASATLEDPVAKLSPSALDRLRNPPRQPL